MNANHWLQFLRSDGMVLAHTRAVDDWGVCLEQREAIFFHFVTQGRAYISVDNGTPIRLEAGDIAVLSRGAEHRLQSAPGARVAPLFEFLKANDGIFSESEQATNVICGAFGLDRYMVLPALRSLPELFCIKASPDNRQSPVATALRQLKGEVEGSGVASRVMVRHLLSALFIYILREWIESFEGNSDGWFAAMQNPNISRALESIHTRPAQAWTLTSLAREAGLSRAAFAKQFRALVGETPYAYLTRWRMGVASQLLEETDMTLAQIAIQVGYGSEYSFSRAFKQVRGKPPAYERRTSAAEVSSVE